MDHLRELLVADLLLSVLAEMHAHKIGVEVKRDRLVQLRMTHDLFEAFCLNSGHQMVNNPDLNSNNRKR